MPETMTHTFVEQCESTIAELIASVPPDLKPVAESDPSRWTALRAAQAADYTNTPEAEEEHARLRMTAAAGRERMRLERGGAVGRPHTSPEQTALADFEARQREAADDYALALTRFREAVERLTAAGPDLDRIEALAGEQQAAIASTVEHLSAAADSYKAACQAKDDGKALMRQYAGIVSFSADPYCDIGQPVNFLSNVLKLVTARVLAEEARLGLDPAAEQADQQERREAGRYQAELATACKTLRSTSDGQSLWSRYRSAVKRHEEAVAAEPMADHSAERTRLQDILDALHEAACTFAGLPVHKHLFPRLG
jgi:hypothetical protein